MWVLRMFEFACEYIYICNIYIYYRGKVSTRSRLFFFSSLLDYPSLWSFVLFFFAVRVVATCSFPSGSWKERSLPVFLTDRPPLPSASLASSSVGRVANETKKKGKRKKHKHLSCARKKCFQKPSTSSTHKREHGNASFTFNSHHNKLILLRIVKKQRQIFREKSY